MRRAFVVVLTVLSIQAFRAPASDAGHVPVTVVAGDEAGPGARIGSPAPPTSGIERSSEADAPDPTSLQQTHAVYFVPKDRLDSNLDNDGTIANSLRAVRAWFVRETGSLAVRPRVDTYNGAFDISFLRGAADAATYTSLDTIVAELRTHGYAETNKRYLIYAEVDRGDVCGEAYYPIPPVLDQGQYSVIYLSSSSCAARDYGDGTVAGSGRTDAIATHEWLHNEGLAPVGAPHYCPTSPYHVCTGALWLAEGVDPEQVDALFPLITGTLQDTVLDRGHDDYLDHGWPWLPNLRASPWLENA